ncbi:MAG: hypothetical protein IRZ00_08215 [Gemmatimonadetes bacterium]|nr:hypothetical protein [Gemmatimonadota bacterium]
MPCTLRAVCSPEVAVGFELAGIRAERAATPAEGAARVRRALEEPGLGVLLVEERLFDALTAEDRRELGRRPLPLVVPFPSPAWGAASSPEARIVEILRQAIGYRVRLR